MGYYVVHQFYYVELPDTPFNLARTHKLWDYVNAEEGAKVEVFKDLISIDGAPRPPIPDSPRAKPRTLRQAYEEMKALKEEYRKAWEEEHRAAAAEAADE